MASLEEKLLRNFVFGRLLNQGNNHSFPSESSSLPNIVDTRAKTVNLLGKIDSQPAIVIAEKIAFAAEPEFLESFLQPSHLSALSLVERNDIYHWFLASQTSGELPRHADAKLTLIFPATETHIRKYSFQSLRVVTETPEIYREHVLPFVISKSEGGRLNWVYNILQKERESESIIIEDTDEQEGFILLPDL